MKKKLTIDSITQETILRGLLIDFIRKGWKELDKKRTKQKVFVVSEAEILLGRLG